MNNTRDKTSLKEFGEHFKKIRKAKKQSLRDVAFAADIELSQVHRIEQGKINPTLTTILLLAEALDISPAVLFEYKQKN